MSEVQTKTASGAEQNQATDAKAKAEEFAAMVSTKTAEAMGEQMSALGKTMTEGFEKLIGALTTKTAPAEDVDAEAKDFAAGLEKSAREYELAAQRSQGPSAAEVLGGAAKNGGVRVKAPVEMYSQTKSALAWGRDRFYKGRVEHAGEPAHYCDNGTERYVDDLSEKDKAVSGAWVKYQAAPALRKLGVDVRFTDHDIDMLRWTLRNEKFVVGTEDGKPASRRKLREAEIRDMEAKMFAMSGEKATVIIDDSTSGGQNAIPEVYDDAIIRTPLVHSELLPHVTVVTLGKGRGLEGAQIGTPSFSSTASGTAVTPITTDSFVSDYTIPVFPASCAVEFGLDFLSDALPTFFAAVQDQIGQAGLQWIDTQIASGDGTTEPQGIITASGQSVSSTSGSSGPLVIGDLIALIFGIDKAHRMAYGGMDCGFVMSDTNYKRFRALQTGISGDIRLALGSTVKSYEALEYPVWVAPSFTNLQACFVNAKGYTLVRRQGLQFVTDDTGRTNRLANKRLLMGRMRFGGKLRLTTYVSQMTDLKELA